MPSPCSSAPARNDDELSLCVPVPLHRLAPLTPRIFARPRLGFYEIPLSRLNLLLLRFRLDGARRVVRIIFLSR